MVFSKPYISAEKMAYNILIVDDSPSMRQVIRRTIQISGFNVGHFYEVSNGKEALDLLGNEWVDVILSDINMPVMDGITFIKLLQKDIITANIPVVVITTEGREACLKQFMDLGVTAYLQKPFRPETIRNKLIQILGNNEKSPDDDQALNGYEF
ncbi:MAG: Chemotaxis protein cheY [Candidatus Magnetoglobus multicellularis str. Araruama]|uniref:Chemotaxis protein cheY n=1 Tax=Candidatus Magnetoglobus multicellularis str. Araruama TaxID=890399 RepID=A0A1V1PH10_9BACT|nr:MAG: Chemotaxis protein cheY [Candidatus Magnetoglobus multicellularis str. Araruama]